LERMIRPRDKRQELVKCSLQESVEQHLHLLFTTSFGEFLADSNFGCGIWDNDFDNVTSDHKLKETIRLSLLNAIKDHEKRLRQVRVEITLQQKEIVTARTNATIKKRIDINVSAVFNSTNEKFNFLDIFFVGPLSY